MKVTILAFGKLADLLPQQEWEMTDLETAGSARRQIEEQFPALKNMRYRIAVDKKIATDDTPLGHHSVVALLPPFSGG
jgi:molybdopterin synthase sulfur carrier subunit